MDTTRQTGDAQSTSRMQPTAKSRIALIVALSIVAGLIAAAVLVAVPLSPPNENSLTGVVLLGFGLGSTLLALLSARFSD
ncbi:MAG TPA: hypothetical protein VIP98_18365 [Microlunatus sp.]